MRPVVPFQRIRDAKAREAHEVSLILPQVEVGHSVVLFVAWEGG